MLLVQNITSDALQKQTLVLPNGASFTLTMYFRPMQYGWFINELVYGSFTLNGVRITNLPNILHQFRNQLPFGLGCFTVADREPSQQDDFSSGVAQLFVLTADEVEQYAEFLRGG